MDTETTLFTQQLQTAPNTDLDLGQHGTRRIPARTGRDVLSRQTGSDHIPLGF